MKPGILLLLFSTLFWLCPESLAEHGYLVFIHGNVAFQLMTDVRNCRSTPCTWLPEKQQDRYYQLTPSLPLNRDFYQNFSVTMIPSGDGVLTLNLRGPYRCRKAGKTKFWTQQWVLYTDIRAKGAVLKNGSFDQPSAEDPWLPAHWKLLTSVRQPEAKWLRERGGNAVKVWHEGSVSQSFAVRRNQPVTITFAAKCAEEVLPEE